MEIRAPDLASYQDAAYARSYVEFVRQVAAREQERAPGQTRIAEAVARHLYKLMAYKDEYEVARLLLREGARSGDPQAVPVQAPACTGNCTRRSSARWE